MYDLVVVGGVCVDVLVKGVDIRNAFQKETTPADGITFAVGGDAINEAVAAAKLGIHVRLITGMGDDFVAGMIKEHMRRHGLKTDGIRICENSETSVNCVVVDKRGERRFLAPPFAPSASFRPDSELLCPARVLSLASLFVPPLDVPEYVLPLVKKARQLDMIICADMNMRPGMNLDMYSEVLPFVDYIFPNAEESAYFTGERDPIHAASVFHNYGVKTVVAKLGAKGCCLCTEEGNTPVAGYKVECLDTTGAGDNFAAGFATGLAMGYTPQECAQLACTMGALAVTQVGASAAVRDWMQVSHMMQYGERYQ